MRDARLAAAAKAEDEPHASEVEAEVSWQDRLLEALLAMEPAAFERLCQRLLREAGFSRTQVTGRSGDGGIDGLGVYRVSLVSFQVFEALCDLLVKHRLGVQVRERIELDVEVDQNALDAI